MAHVKQAIVRVRQAEPARVMLKVVTMRIPEDEYLALRAAAEKEERPFSNFVRTVLRRELQRRQESDGGGDARRR